VADLRARHKAREIRLWRLLNRRADQEVIQQRRRLADEYDAAQERGEVATANEGRPRRSGAERLPAAADVGLSRKEIHEARLIRDAEAALPGAITATALAMRPDRAASHNKFCAVPMRESGKSKHDGDGITVPATAG